jgi:hypothetical protein
MNNQLRKTAGFGAKLNTYEWPRRQANYPAWANPGQRDDWRSRGLVLWKDEARQITRGERTGSSSGLAGR